jgi:prevent-host-death family protein
MDLRRSTFRRLSAAAKRGPVIITTYGKPTHALLTLEEYNRLAATRGLGIVSETDAPASEIGQGFSPGIVTPKKSGL